ncbi:Ubiquitin supergroup [Beauveria brongniartii RCEF 3172]|uniref:Ubiquitin supergroup n=1 Tax=Beauveria brongniartii RCEF 3172 TaxID=1081107 RepID=A0A167KYW3_9HYPO|nr:Ubiquitin supergroup [Beauveria brongniartii RCEF 3172]
MAETAFAKTFLTTLSGRPPVLSPDHVEDARNFPARPPYILPRMPTEMSKPRGRGAAPPGQERSVMVTLRSLRNPPLDITLAAQALDTSLLDVKQATAARARIPADKLKILHNKRPVPDSKILRDVVGEGQTAVVEFSVMVIGGAAAVLPEEEEEVVMDVDGADDDDAGEGAAAARRRRAEKGEAAVEQDKFWEDLNGFLMQRVKDEDTAAELTTVFKNAWEAHKAKP